MPNSLRLRYLLPCSLLWMLIVLLGVSTEAQATHIRAGDITAKRDTTPNPNPRRFFFTMIIYTDDDSNVEDPTVIISMGDGNTRTVSRQGGEIPIGNRVSKAIYKWDYTYGADGTYIVSWNGINRNNNILNIAPPSQDVSFLIATTITINALRGFNSTPVLTVAPIDNAAIGRKFVHNPGAYDADGDSLAFKLRVPMRIDASGRATPVPGYSLPNRTFNCPTSTGAGSATFTLDIVDGQLVWDAPCRKGEYNIAFVVEEWRVTVREDGKRVAVKLGEVIRDMQITVLENENRPPVLQPKDTCIVAGTNFSAIVRATDPDNDRISITANSGIIPPATFRQITDNPGAATGRVTWQTECLDVRERPYQIVFRAEDVRPNIGGTVTRLADLQPWNIRVVGPPPQNLRTSTRGQSVILTWDPYICQNASVMKIYRREGKSGFVPDNCETGVPGGLGFVLIGEVRRSGTVWPTEFVDDKVEPGIEYCYIIYAEFPSPGRGESLASNEACAQVELEVPLLTNVTVDATSTTAGQITVRWTQPRKLDDLIAPLQYRLFRRVVGQPNTSYTEVKRTSVLSDTVFVDRNLNTTEQAYRYKLEFYESVTPSGPPSVRVDSTSASSVRLNVTPSQGENKVITLAWAYSVPWKNEVLRHLIYRKTGNEPYVLIDSVNATSTGGTYTDLGAFQNLGLNRGENYCYYVVTRGTYQLPSVKEPLLNRSQEMCALLPKLICAPELSIEPLNCEAFTANPTDPPFRNVLTWVPKITGDCTDEIDFYTIYFKAPGEENYREIARVQETETTFIHEGLESFAGCYVVTATDVLGRESVFSNEVCNDNCISFILPNIITPNGDGKNDVFRPKRAVFIRSIRFVVFNRWGVKVYEGNDPAINWAGVDNDGNRLTDGTYYYEAQVEFITLDPTNASKKYKGWVEIVR